MEHTVAFIDVLMNAFVLFAVCYVDGYRFGAKVLIWMTPAWNWECLQAGRAWTIDRIDRSHRIFPVFYTHNNKVFAPENSWIDARMYSLVALRGLWMIERIAGIIYGYFCLWNVFLKNFPRRFKKKVRFFHRSHNIVIAHTHIHMLFPFFDFDLMLLALSSLIL